MTNYVIVCKIPTGEKFHVGNAFYTTKNVARLDLQDLKANKRKEFSKMNFIHVEDNNQKDSFTIVDDIQKSTTTYTIIPIKNYNLLF